MAEVKMRETDETSGSLFGYVDLKERILPRHPLRKIQQVVYDSLVSLYAEAEVFQTDFGRSSIPQKRLLRESLLKSFFRFGPSGS